MNDSPRDRVEVVRTYLELRGRDALRAARPRVWQGDQLPQLERRQRMSATDYRALYSAVGGPWHWRDRLVWSNDELEIHLSSPAVHVFTLRIGSDVAGYFELQRHDDGHAEIMYFGLDTRFMGQGLGGWMLTRAVEEAFALGVERVTLNTCTLDAPQALPNYIARGFTIVREEKYAVELPCSDPLLARTASPTA